MCLQPLAEPETQHVKRVSYLCLTHQKSPNYFLQGSWASPCNDTSSLRRYLGKNAYWRVDDLCILLESLPVWVESLPGWVRSLPS